MNNDPNELVVAWECQDRMLAEVYRSALESCGIDAGVTVDDVGGLRPDLTLLAGAKIIVRQQDRLQAIEIIQDLENHAQKQDDLDTGDDCAEQYSTQARSPSEAELKTLNRGFTLMMIGIILAPGVLHLYVLMTYLPLFKRWMVFSMRDRLKFLFTVAVSFLVTFGLGYFLFYADIMKVLG